MDDSIQDAQSKNLTTFGKVRNWQYSGKNSLGNVVEFEYIMNYTKPVVQVFDDKSWELKGAMWAISGGSRKHGNET